MIYKGIESRTVELLRSNALYTVPIDVFALATLLGIKFEKIDIQDNVSGFFLTKGSTPIIGYNSSESPQRIRFTIAHEIGHYLLHSKVLPLFIDKKEGVRLNRDDNSKSGEIRLEREANAFAAALLMPAELLKEELPKFEKIEGRALIAGLAATFNVSVDAMAYRLSNLELVTVGL